MIGSLDNCTWKIWAAKGFPLLIGVAREQSKLGVIQQSKQSLVLTTTHPWISIQKSLAVNGYFMWGVKVSWVEVIYRPTSSAGWEMHEPHRLQVVLKKSGLASLASWKLLAGHFPYPFHDSARDLWGALPWFWERCTVVTVNQLSTWWFNGFICDSVYMNHLIETWPVWWIKNYYAVFDGIAVLPLGGSRFVNLWLTLPACGGEEFCWLLHCCLGKLARAKLLWPQTRVPGRIWNRIAGIIALKSLTNHAWKSIIWLLCHVCIYVMFVIFIL